MEQDTLAEYQSELEKQTREYLDRLSQIDLILRGPIRTLLRYTCGGTLANSSDERPKPLTVPEWLQEKRLVSHEYDPLSTYACLTTVQRLLNIIRRFPWLESEAKETINAIKDILTVRYNQPIDPETYFQQYFNMLYSPTFGRLNPVTAADTFRLLMRLGEEYAHSGLGCLSFFAILWPLKRHTPGAKIEPSARNAYVTAACLLPLIELRDMCEKRARLYRQLCGDLKELEGSSGATDPYEIWKFCVGLDELRRHLAELKPIAIDLAALKDCESAIEVLIEHRDANSATEQDFYGVLETLFKALERIAGTSAIVHERADHIAHDIETRIVMRLEGLRNYLCGDGDKAQTSDQAESFESLRQWFAENGFLFDIDIAAGAESPVCAIATAARESLTLCTWIIREIQRAAESTPRQIDTESVTDALTRLADSNKNVADLLRQPIREHARWCESILNREIAYASADNLTDFDAAELASAMTVVIRAGILESRPQVEDAIAKTLVGMQRDGSWRLGAPYFLVNGTAGIRSPSAEIVWTLASAIKFFPQIRVADEYLFRYVDWLERTQRTLLRDNACLSELIPEPFRDTEDAPKLESVLVRYLSDTIGKEPDVGWPADRVRKPHEIHLQTTAHAVNALLTIRELVEHRLWELCERRFTVVPPSVSLKMMDPVDLMAPHPKRLHYHLAEIARKTQAADSDAEYALILHGPPGSSKTAVAGALSQEMWKGTRRWGRSGSRMIRITPADFTRMGEDRVDSEAQVIFSLLSHVRGVTILFDEIDDLLRRRDFATKERARFLDLVTPAMLNRLQDLRDVCKQQEICFLFGTNYIEKIEPALMRQGRIDARLAVVYPDPESRRALAYKAFRDWRKKRDSDLELEQSVLQKSAALLARKASAWSWSSYVRLCKQFTKDVFPTETRRGPDGGRRGASNAATDPEGPPGQARAGSAEVRSEGGSENLVPPRYGSWAFAPDAGASDQSNNLDAAVTSIVEEWWKSQGSTHSPEAELRRDYERRLNESPGSAELHTEYLQYLVCLLGGSEKPTANVLRESFGESELDKHLREHLIEDVDLLPHVGNGTGSPHGVIGAGTKLG